MRVFEDEVVIARPVDMVWPVLADVRAWPKWTASMEWLEPLDGEKLVRGARVRVKQPTLRAIDLSITVWDPPHSFSWGGSASWGLRARADHLLVPHMRGCIFRQRFVIEGAASPLAGWAMGKLIRSYLRMEAQGLKCFVEAQPMPTPEPKPALVGS